MLRKLMLLSVIIAVQPISCNPSKDEVYQNLWDVMIRCKARSNQTYEQSCGKWYEKFKDQVNDYMSDDRSKDTPLHDAASTDNLDIAKLLIVNGADLTRLNRSGHMPIHEAAIVGSARIVELLVNNGVNSEAQTCDSQHSTAMQIAQRYYNYNVVGALKAAGARF